MIRLSRYSRGRTDYHSPSSSSPRFLPGSPWEIPREERRSRTAAAHRPRSAARHFRFSNRRPYPPRTQHERTDERAFVFSRTMDADPRAPRSISRHVRTILHFPTTKTACAFARPRPPIWRTAYDLIFRVPRRNSLCSSLSLALARGGSLQEGAVSSSFFSPSSFAFGDLSRTTGLATAAIGGRYQDIYIRSNRKGTARSFRVGGHARGSAAHGCCRGLYDNTAGWIPPHYNMNSVRLGHVRLTIACVCVSRGHVCIARVRVVRFGSSLSTIFPPVSVSIGRARSLPPLLVLPPGFAARRRELIIHCERPTKSRTGLEEGETRAIGG